MTSECGPQSSEEKKMPDSSSSSENIGAHRKSSSITMTNVSSSTSTELVLESMEECVGCIDGIKEQQTFEENLLKQAIHQREIAMEHGLSEAEAALIRMQIDNATTAATGIASSAANGIRSAMENEFSTNIIYPHLEDLLEQVCGVQDSTSSCLPSTTAHSGNEGASKVCGGGNGISCDLTGKNSLSADLCKGVILPIDTTMPTSLPGNALVESRQEKTARSLVDVAAEDDALQDSLEEENFSVDADAINECAICSDSAFTCDIIDHDGSTSPSTKSTIGSTGPTSSLRKPVFCRLPCCENLRGRKHSNFNVCTACILVLTVATKDGVNRVGRCPRCRQWISILTLHSTSAPMEVRKLQSTGKCGGCHKIASPLIIEDPPTCDECFLSEEMSLSYECEDCHQPQKMKSTMYRSQTSAKSFGDEIHMCNNCKKPTHWRLAEDQLCFIPANDVPEEWGDDFLELARIRVQTARQGIAKLNLVGKNMHLQSEMNEGCTVM